VVAAVRRELEVNQEKNQKKEQLRKNIVIMII
jgi:hypothetical protein